ncbi:MAG TPA: phasin family protein [Rhizobiaceae bacterium]|nr:phasin family protein [Rhizobiaceae bacterium]
MTRTSAKTNGPSAGFASIQDAFENIQAQLEVPTVARDFLKRTATSARERAESAHSGAASATEGIEKFASSMVAGYAKLTRGLLDMALANVQHSLSTVEKLAGAKSVNEAVQLQAEFLRDNAQANFDRVRDTAENSRATLTQGAQIVQAEIFRLYGSKAA